MEPERSLPCLQEPATGPFLEPDASSPTFPHNFPKIHSNIIFPSTTRSLEWSLPYRFPMKILHLFLISPKHEFPSNSALNETRNANFSHIILFKYNWMEVNGPIHDGGKSPGIHWLRDCVGPGSGRGLSLPLSVVEPLVSHPLASHFTDWAKPRYTRMYPKISRLAAWSENCKRYSSLPLGAVVSLFCESV
jgi:hypothetical protein